MADNILDDNVPTDTPYGLDPLTLQKLQAAGIDPKTYIESFGPAPTVSSINPTDPSNVAGANVSQPIPATEPVLPGRKLPGEVGINPSEPFPGANAQPGSPALAKQTLEDMNPYGPKPPLGVADLVSNDPTQSIPPSPRTELNPSGFVNSQLSNLDIKVAAQQKEAQNQSQGFLADRDINAQAANDQKDREARMEAFRTQSREEDKVRSQNLLNQTEAEHQELLTKSREQYNQKIDPERYWNNKSTAGKILAGIGILLGGLGGGIAKTGRNPAMEQINKAIDADIDAQKAERENNFKAIDAMMKENQLTGTRKRDIINDIYTKDQHDLEHMKWNKVAALEVVKLQLASNAANTKSETVKNQALQAIADLKLQQDAIRAEIYNAKVRAAQAAAAADAAKTEKLSKEASDRYQNRIDAGFSPDAAAAATFDDPRFGRLVQKGLAPTRFYNNKQNYMAAQAALAQLKSEGKSEEEAMQIVKSNPDFAKAMDVHDSAFETTAQRKAQQAEDKDLRGRTIVHNLGSGPMQIVAKDAKTADEVKKSLSTLTDEQMILDDLSKLRAKNGNNPLSWSPSDRALYDANINKMRMSLQHDVSGAAVTNKERKEFLAQFPEVGSWLRTDISGRDAALFSRMKSTHATHMNNVLEGLEVKPYTPPGTPKTAVSPSVQTPGAAPAQQPKTNFPTLKPRTDAK